MSTVAENARDTGTLQVEGDGVRDPKTGRFRPGVSGGGGPHKKGKRHQASQLAQALIDGESEEIIRKVIEGAKAGDAACLRMAIDRLAPVKKSAPIKFDLPPVETLDDARRASAMILAGQAEGELTAEEAKGLMDTLEVNVRFGSLAELEKRIAQLEGGNG